MISIAAPARPGGPGAGLEVRVGQLHGMSQRGGSVEATCVPGPGRRASSPLGEADVLWGSSPSRRCARCPACLPVVVVLADCIRTRSPTRADALYPIDELRERIRGDHRARLAVDDASTRVAREAGDPRSTNVVMLGALAAFELLPVGGVAIRRSRRGRDTREACRLRRGLGDGETRGPARRGRGALAWSVFMP